jgi:hypothetical protein
VNALLKLLDRLMESLSPDVVKSIRVAAIMVWIFIALIVVYFSYKRGGHKSPDPKDEYITSEIKEKALKEKNLKKRPDVTVPEIRDLAPEGEETPLPSPVDRVRSGLSGGESGSLPPFVGEQSIPVFPEKHYLPPQKGEDIREPLPDESRTPMIPLKPGEEGENVPQQEKIPPASPGNESDASSESGGSPGEYPGQKGVEESLERSMKERLWKKKREGEVQLLPP